MTSKHTRAGKHREGAQAQWTEDAASDILRFACACVNSSPPGVSLSVLMKGKVSGEIRVLMKGKVSGEIRSGSDWSRLVLAEAHRL